MKLDGQAVAMLRTMAEMQDMHNCHVHPEWRTQGYEYYRAIWVECAELLDHFGWKWWKHQSPDIDQVKLEIVDIWHFALSDLLRADELTDELAAHLVFDVQPGATDTDAFRAAGRSPRRNHAQGASLRSRAFRGSHADPADWFAGAL